MLKAMFEYNDTSLFQTDNSFLCNRTYIWQTLACSILAATVCAYILIRIGIMFNRFIYIPCCNLFSAESSHDDVIKWKHFPRYWPFVRGIHRSPVNSPHKGQWRGALMFSLICVWINDWVNNREAGDLRPYRAHYDVIVMNWTNADLSSIGPLATNIGIKIQNLSLKKMHLQISFAKHRP